MKVEIKKLPKSQVEIEVTLNDSEIKSYYDRALSDLSKTFEVKGFRPGKVPRETAEKMLGKEKILVEAADISVRELYPKIITEKAIEIIGRPEIEITKADSKGFFWTARASVLPEVKPADYKKIAKGVERRKAPVKAEEINEALNYLQESRVQISEVKRPAQLGDLVEIDFDGSVGGVKLEGAQSKNHPLVLGKGKFIPGFENELVGLEAGAEKSFSLNIASDYWDKNILPILSPAKPEEQNRGSSISQPNPKDLGEIGEGKKIDFHVKMERVSGRNLPELNDEFARGLGKFENLLQLKSSVENGLRMEKEAKEKERRRIEIAEKIAENSQMEVPGLLVEEEIKKMVHELSHTIGRHGQKLEDYLAHIKKSVDDLKKDFEKNAVGRVRTALVLREIARLEKISVADEELAAKVQEILRTVPPEEQKKIDLEELKIYANGLVRNEKVFELLESY